MSSILFLLGISLIMVLPTLTLAQTNTTATQLNEIFTVNHEFTPVIVSDSAKNILIAWSNIQPDNNNEILLMKFSPSGTPLWSDNIIVARPESKVKFLSIDTDPSNNISLAWTASVDGSRHHAIFLNRYDPDGFSLWSEPMRVMEAINSTTDLLSLSDVGIDIKGNAYLLSLQRDTNTGTINLWYQIVHPDGNLLWPNGKKIIPPDRRAPISPEFPIDLEVVKKHSVAYITWVSKDTSNSTTINLQKISYDGVLMWYSTHLYPLSSDFSTIQYPGVELDSRENIVMTAVSYLPTQRHQTILHWKRINRFGQTLWEDRLTTNVVPSEIINTVGFTVSDNGKIVFVINHKGAIETFGVEAGMNSSDPSNYQRANKTILSKNTIGPSMMKVGHTTRGSVNRIDGTKTIVSWNETDVQFIQKPGYNLQLDTVGNERVYFMIFETNNFSTIQPKTYVDTMRLDYSRPNHPINQPMPRKLKRVSPAYRMPNRTIIH